MTFGERLEARRKEIGWSQAELARRSAIPQGLISRMERGLVKEPGMTIIRRLAQTLQTTSDYLVGMYDIPPSACLAPVGAAP